MSTTNDRYQLWGEIFVTFLALLIILYCLITIFGWGLFTPDFGSFKNHWPWLKDALFDQMRESDQKWLAYWKVISNNGHKIHFYCHSIIPALIAFICSFWLTKWFLWVDGGRDPARHIKGSQLYTENKAVRHAHQKYKEDYRRDSRSRPGIFVHPKIRITNLREQTNMLVLGTTGTGKSMTIKPLLEQIIKRGDYSLIYDEKKEYTGAFFNPATTHLIAPWDRRSAAWNISDDVLTSSDAALVASCLIPDNKDKDQVWIKGARLLFTGMIVCAMQNSKKWGWSDLATMLREPQENMHRLLSEHFPIATSFIQENSRTTQGFYVNLISDLNWLEQISIAWNNQNEYSFSIRKWLHSNTDKKTIIIQADTRFSSIGAPLCNALISLMTSHFLALKDNANRNTWLFIDEAANLPPNPSIKKWLELARSRGARSVIGTQSISQLKDLYGLHNTDSILNLLSTVISLRIGAAGDDAKYTSGIFSERIVERRQSNQPNSDWVRTREALVEPFELTQLELPGKSGVEGFMLIPGWDAVYRLRWPLFINSPIAHEHIPARWISENPNKPKSAPEINPLFNRSNAC